MTMISKIHKRFPFGPVFQGLIADPKAKHYHRMKNAVWLYLYLIVFSNLRTGKLITRFADIALDMGLPEETLLSWLGHLKKWHYVTVEKQGEELLFKIMKWQNIAEELEKPIPEKSSRQRSTETKERSHAPEPELLFANDPAEMANHIANLLDEPSYRGPIEALCRVNSRDVILRAVTKAREVANEDIRRSRGALFVYLVKKYAQEQSSAGN